MALVRCPKHGRIYDSDAASGCPQCLTSRGSAPVGRAKPEPEPRGTNRFLLMLIGVVVVGGGGYLAWTRNQRAQTEAAAAAERARLDVLREERVDTTRFARANDLTPIRRARALAAAIDALLDANRTALLRFPEGPIDTAAADPAAKRAARDYAAFAERWHARLDAATRDGHDFRYEPGVQFSLQMERVTNQLDAALAVSRDMVPRDYVKPRGERQSDYTAATGYVSGARTELTTLPATSAPRSAPARRSTRRR